MSNEKDRLQDFVLHNALRDDKIQPRLSGEDRSALYKATVRLGRPYKSSIKKVEKTTAPRQVAK